MKFFLDENFPKSARALLESRGHEVIDNREEDTAGADDRAVFVKAQRHQAVFLTTDRDFFHTVPHLFDRHRGAVVVALRQPNRERIIARLRWFLDHFEDVSIEQKVIELRDRTYVLVPSANE